MVDGLRITILATIGGSDWYRFFSLSVTVTSVATTVPCHNSLMLM